MGQFQRLSPCGAPGLRAMRGLRRLAGCAGAVWGEYAVRGRRSQTGVLLALAGLLMVLSTACGGGEVPAAPEASGATGTPEGERTEREGRAAAAEQTEAQTGAQEVEGEQAAQEVEGEQAAQAEATAESAQVENEAVAQEAESQTESQAAEAEFEDESEETITFEGELVDRIAAALAEHRAGLAVERNVLGDADAPVLIVEYGDFQ